MNYSKQENEKRRKASKSNVKKAKNKVASLVLRVSIAVLLIGIFVGGGAIFGAYMGIIEGAPELEQVVILPNIYTTIIYSDKTGEEIDRLKGEENREYVAFDKVPKVLRDAVVAIEDERFYSHDGVDIKGLARALYVILSTAGQRREGASTITQQVIKNNVMNLTRNTVETKLQEQYLAVKFEKMLTEQFNGNKKAAKDYILEIYLNSIALHHNLNGVQTASNYYFNKPVSDLTLSEAAVIAGITQYPSLYAPDVNPTESKKRQKMVLNNMLRLKFITQREYDDAVADDVYARVTGTTITEDSPAYHSYFTDSLVSTISKDLQDKYKISSAEASNWIYNSGLKIYSTQDLEMQKIMDDAFADPSLFPKKVEFDLQYTIAVKNTITGKVNNIYRTKLGAKENEIEAFKDAVKNEVLGSNDIVFAEKLVPFPQPQAAMVVMDYFNGQVKAMTGGRGQKLTDRGLNRATDSPRQPGSVFKVLASFAAGIDLGVITPATLIEDAPYSYAGHPFSNWNRTYKGWTTVRTAIKDSMNVVTVKNFMINTGMDACYEYLKNFGFTTLVDGKIINGQYKTDKVPATALGGITEGVTQLETAAAYGAIANEGVYNKPILYTKVLSHDNEILLENLPEPKRILKKQSAYLLTDMMKDVIRAGTGGKAAFKNLKMPIAGKTGTSSDTKDLTFAGYTPYYVGSIWMGYDMPKTIPEETSGYHLQLWSRVMEQINAPFPIKDFQRPEGVVNASICRASGKLAIKGLCDKDPHRGVVSDVFMAGTEPKTTCDIHVSLVIDSSTGQKFSPSCPDVYRKEVIGILSETNPYDIADYYFSKSFIDGPECSVHTGGGTPMTVPFPDHGFPDGFLTTPTPQPPYQREPVVVPEPEPDDVFGGDVVEPGLPSVPTAPPEITNPVRP